jgi:phage terminase large subunit-like protein
MNSIEELRQTIQNMHFDAKMNFLNSLSKQERLICLRNPDLFLFDKQLIPDDWSWRYYFMQCGRSFGKTYTGAAWVAKKIRKGAKVIGLCGPKYEDVVRKMVPAITSWFLKEEFVNPDTPYNSQTHTIRFKNGAVIYCMTSDVEQRGDNLEYLWCDEICIWADGLADKVKERFDVLDMAVRIGDHPQTLITSTPKSFPLFWEWEKAASLPNSIYKIGRGSMMDNPTLPSSYIQAQIDKHKNDPLMLRQEVYGELVMEHPHAMFHSEWIDEARITDPANKSRDQKTDLLYFFNKVSEGEIHIKRVVVSVDPSGSGKSTSDECGIVVVAQDFKGELYVIHDKSGRMSANEWGKQARSLYYHYKHHFPNTIIKAETNFGGETVTQTIQGADSSLVQDRDIKGENTGKGKLLRAEPAAAKYQRGKIHHVGYFELLERQMCNYTGTKQEKSPDRMDALVHAINELTVIPQYTNRDLRILDAY